MFEHLVEQRHRLYGDQVSLALHLCVKLTVDSGMLCSCQAWAAVEGLRCHGHAQGTEPPNPLTMGLDACLSQQNCKFSPKPVREHLIHPVFVGQFPDF